MGCGNSSLNVEEGNTNKSPFTLEEKRRIDMIMEENPNLGDLQIAFKKFDISISPNDGVIFREIISLKIVKEQYPCTDNYKYVSNVLDNSNDIQLQVIKVNSVIIKDYKYTKYDGYFEVLIPYTIQKKDYPLFTFELTYSYKQFFCGVFAPISFSTQDLFTNFSFNVIANGFHLAYKEGEIAAGNNYAATKNKIIFNGKNEQEDLYFMFIKDEGIKLDNYSSNLNTDFYYIEESDKSMIESGINDGKIKFSVQNIVSIKDVFNFVEDKAYVTSYITVFSPNAERNREPLEVSFSFRNVPDLQFINYKIGNRITGRNVTIEDDRVTLSSNLDFQPGVFFRTIEYEYSFSLNYNEKNYFSIAVEDRKLLEGCLYQMYIKRDYDRNISLYREWEFDSSEEYCCIAKLPYKGYDDNYFYNYVYVYDYK
jgi:hypothetical protein